MNKGFTLIEIIITVAIVGLLAGISFSSYVYFGGKTDLDTAAQTVVETLRRAQLNAQGMKLDDDWGVKLQNNQAIIFKGNNFTTRNASYDEINSYATSVSNSGISEIYFNKNSGTPSTTGAISLKGKDRSINISINSYGKIDY